MRDRLQNPEMTEERARSIVSHVVAERLRWGKHYDGGDIDGGMVAVFDALILLAYAENAEQSELRNSLATANRQLGAAKAREVKQRKQIETLKDELKVRTEDLEAGQDDPA